MRLTIDVTMADIDEGDDSCAGCPVAIAATRALHEAGFDKEWQAKYEPYRAFCTPAGFEILYRGETVLALPPHEFSEEAYEFASMFDDWFRQEYRGEESTEEEPWERPDPFSFTVDIDLAVPAKGANHA